MRNFLLATFLIVLAVLGALFVGWPNSITPSPLQSEEQMAATLSMTRSEVPMEVAIFVTGTSQAPEAATFEGGSWTKQRTLAHSAFAICHPDGLVVFDSGLGPNIGNQFRDMPGTVRLMIAFDFISSAKAQIEEANFCPDKPIQLVLSHLHWDHAGGIEEFEGVPVWVRSEELAHSKSSGNQSGYLASQTDSKSINWQQIIFDDIPYSLYDVSHDFFGDGRLIIVPMSGHTRGSVGLFLNLSENDRYFLTGDTSWVLEGFKKPAHKYWLLRSMVDEDVDELEHEIERVYQIMNANPALKVIPAHDFSAYPQDLIITSVNQP